jgi:signal transduction histidine kinase/ligand-binding sensor domain-containing protein
MLKFAALIFLNCSLYLTYGQDKQFIAFHKYTQNEGLSSYNITKIIQDRYGFIWAGTQDGLNRFDGVRFFSYNQQGNKKYHIPGANISDMKEDTARNLLWVVTSYGGIAGISLNTLNVLEKIERIGQVDLSEKWLRSVEVSGNILWVGSNNALYALDIANKKQLNLNYEGFAINPGRFDISRLFRDKYNRIWAFCNNQGVMVFNGSTGKLLQYIPITELRLDKAADPVTVWEVTGTAGNEVFAATSIGLLAFKSEPNKVVTNLLGQDPLFTSTGMFGCTVDKENNVWFSSATDLYKYNLASKRTDRIADAASPSDAWTSTIYYLFNDRDNNIWAGSQMGLGYFGVSEGVFTAYNKSLTSETNIAHAYTIYPANDTTVYCGATDGLYKLHTRTRSISKLQHGEYFFLIFKMPDGNVLVSYSLGLFVLVKDKLIPVASVYPFMKGIKNELLNSAIQINDSLVLVGTQTQKGIYLLNLKNQTLRNYTNENSGLGLDKNIVTALFKDRKNNIWVLSESMILQFNPFTGQHRVVRLTNPFNGSRYSIFYDMCETGSSYWIAAYGTGLIETDKSMKLKRVISSANGLSNNAVYKVFAVEDSLVMVTSNNGLSVIKPYQNSIKHYYQSDGLHSSAFENFCGYQDKKRIYAGGVNGFTGINPAAFSVNTTAPKLYFTQIQIKTSTLMMDTSSLSMKLFSVPDNWLQTTVFFSGLNYANPRRVTYQYKIKEIDTGWNNIGNRNFVTLIGLIPGTYHIQVMAANEDDVWSAPIELTLVFLPKWYQTWWFKALIALLLMSILYSLYRYRLAQVKKEQAIRQRIAGDLHDDIGSTLNSVKVFANLALMTPDNNSSYLQQLKEGVQSAIVGVRDMVWVLDDKQDTLDHLVGRIEQFILPLAAAQDIQFEKSLDPSLADNMLKKEEKRNLYLIIKEALNNSFKYAEATTLQLHIVKLPHDQYRISIHDNGKGFNAETVQKGNGLNNLYYRAQQIKYAIEVKSVPGKGTTITLTKG